MNTVEVAPNVAAFCGAHRLVALAPVPDLLLRAKHLLSEATTARANRRAV